MKNYRGGGLFLSLTKHVDFLVQQHIKENKAIRSNAYSHGEGFLRHLLQWHSLFWYVLAYGALIFYGTLIEGLYVTYIPYQFNLIDPALVSHALDRIDGINDLFLGAQATLIGIVFPVALSLVTFLIQREDANSTYTDIKVFYRESLAYEVGVSCLALIVALAVQAAWPADFLLHQAGYGSARSGLLKISMTGFHTIWFVLNCFALWHFLKVCLDFTRPDARTTYRKLYAANLIIPTEIRDHMTMQTYLGAGDAIAKEAGYETLENSSIMVGSGMSLGLSWNEEVVRTISTELVLVDVRFRLLSIVIGHWLKRSETAPKKDNRNRYIIFPLELGRAVSGKVIICATTGDVSLTQLERLLLRFSFKLRRP